MKTMSNGTVGQRLRFARRKMGLTQKELADEIGVGLCSVSNWESDRYEPSLYCVWRVCEFLEVSIDWIAEGCAYR